MSKKTLSVATGTKVEKAKSKLSTPLAPKIKDSTEIDDLFSVLSSSKNSKSNLKTEKEKDYEETNSIGLIDLEDPDDDKNNYYQGSGEDDDEILVKGTSYDPKKDDSFPGINVSLLDDADFFDSRGLKRKTRSLTEDGLPIFSPKELKIGMGGGTDLCPFDCNCCY